jgi:hypothetical protein
MMDGLTLVALDLALPNVGRCEYLPAHKQTIS